MNHPFLGIPIFGNTQLVSLPDFWLPSTNMSDFGDCSPASRIPGWFFSEFFRSLKMLGNPGGSVVVLCLFQAF